MSDHGRDKNRGRSDDHGHRSDRESHKRRRSGSPSRERSKERRRKRSRSHSRPRSGEPRREDRRQSRDTGHRREGRQYRRDRSDDGRVKREPRSEDERRGDRKFVRMEPPQGGWNKPSWEPSGALKEPKSEPGRDGGKVVQEMEKPSFEPSGKLAEDTNTFKGVLIKYNEPPEAKVPKLRWRMYPFKGDEELPVIYIHRQSAYLIGRDRKISDFPIDHPSCSKQHAVLQYRSLPYERSDGTRGRRTRPYIIDLGSGNGTFLNAVRIEAQRYYELKENDVLKFGFSSREYVMLHEQSLQRAEEEEEDTGSEEEDEVDGGVIDRTGGEEKLATAEEDDLF